jgi:hypothetical protein
MARNNRISDNDRYCGPFTLAKCGSCRSFGFHLDSGAGEFPGCNFNVLIGRWWFRVDLPPIVKPWRQWVDMSKYAWANRPGYWDEHANKYGFGLSPEGVIQVWHGAQTHDSTTDKTWCTHLPWTQWRHVRRSFYGLQGEHFWTEAKPCPWEVMDAKRKGCPTVAFLIEDYDGQKITATTRIEEMEWLRGEKWCKWLSWFSKPRIRRSLDIAFSSEVGTEKGSLKGGMMGHGIDMLPGELHEAAFRRYCEQPVRNKYGPSAIKFLGRA